MLLVRTSSHTDCPATSCTGLNSYLDDVLAVLPLYDRSYFTHLYPSSLQLLDTKKPLKARRLRRSIRSDGYSIQLCLASIQSMIKGATDWRDTSVSILEISGRAEDMTLTVNSMSMQISSYRLSKQTTTLRISDCTVFLSIESA